MREWLRETHGTWFELTRHFLLRFFDSEFVTAPGQITTALIGAIHRAAAVVPADRGSAASRSTRIFPICRRRVRTGRRCGRTNCG